MEAQFITNVLYEMFPEGIETNGDVGFVRGARQDIVEGMVSYTHPKEAYYEHYSFAPVFAMATDVYTVIDKPLKLEKEFKLYNKKSIQEFINIHPEINVYLEKALGLINKYFETTKKPEIQLINDPDSTNNNEILFLYIPVNISQVKALELLDKIDELLFEKMELNADIFNINLKFK